MVAAFKRCDGHCEIGMIPDMPEVGCGRKLYPGDINYDHINPDGLTGEPTLENCAVLCRSCHQLKTGKRDVPRIAKAKRREARDIGAYRARRPMPGSKRSGWKKTFNHGWVRRDGQES